MDLRDGRVSSPWRVAVVGGGPAGLMAAEVLATAGVQVTVVERMPTVGRKLQMAGRGGLNLTHSEPIEAFLDRYGVARPWLEAAIGAFGPEDLRAWAHGLGQPTFVGTSGRVFPEALRATALLRAWLARLTAAGVEVRTRHTWLGWDDSGALLLRGPEGITTPLAVDATVLALGGASWPRTGSDGSWVGILDALDVPVVPLGPANCGFVVGWSDVFADRYEGQPLKDVALVHGEARARGDVVITRHGIEGGPVYAIGAALRTTLERGERAVVLVDLFPGATDAEVRDRLARRRRRDTTTTGLRRAGLAPVAIGLLREVTGNQVPREVPELLALLRAVPIEPTRTRPIERAISTAGGVALDAVDHDGMLRSRPGTFVAGEMLDWEAPTGGYLLQAAFSTGVAAARGLLRWLGADSAPR
ncbi:MAG TPA: TIGR03862 family flavoprotein [Acidimicrobiales bacterium]|nr:TIGR03862 family flavoprotein [Acidimicrobiales bacterium]